MTGPHTLPCSEGVLLLGLVRAVLVEGRACTCGMRVERSVCLSMIAGTSQPMFFNISCSLPEGFPMLHTGEQGMDSILKGSIWELVRLLLSPDVVVQLRVTARCWNIGEEKMDPLVPSSCPY